MAATGLVADQDVPDAGIVERVVGGQVGAAGKAEYDVDTFGFEAFHQSVDCTHCDPPFEGSGVYERPR